MQKKDIDWSKLGFGYTPTDYRFEAHWKDGKWDEGKMITDPNIELSEAACVFHYAQCCFEGLKAYTTVKGDIVTFRPDLNAERMMGSAERLEMPAFPKEKFIQAVKDVVAANAAGSALRHRRNTVHPPGHDRLRSSDRCGTGS